MEELNLPQRWYDTAAPKNDFGQYLYGSKHRTKLVKFLSSCNEEERKTLNSYITLSSARQENENFTDYKIRLRFSKQLQRFRNKL